MCMELICILVTWMLMRDSAMYRALFANVSSERFKAYVGGVERMASFGNYVTVAAVRSVFHTCRY